MTEGDAVERLPADECWALLQQHSLGRLAVVRADGDPDIFPVNYTSHEGAIYVRTARDSKLFHIAHHPNVAFEVDSTDGQRYWSVVVHGPAERVVDDQELRESGIRHLVPDAPTQKHLALKISAHSVTGRRFTPREGPATEPVVPFGASIERDVIEVERMPRSTAPNPIPSTPPQRRRIDEDPT